MSDFVISASSYGYYYRIGTAHGGTESGNINLGSHALFAATSDPDIYILKTAVADFSPARAAEGVSADGAGFDVALQIKEPSKESELTLADALTRTQNHFTSADSADVTLVYFSWGNEEGNPGRTRTMSLVQDKVAQTGKWVKDNYPNTKVLVGNLADWTDMFDFGVDWYNACVAAGFTPDGFAYHQYYSRPNIFEELGCKDRIIALTSDIPFYNTEGALAFTSTGPTALLNSEAPASYWAATLAVSARHDIPCAKFTICDEAAETGNGFFEYDLTPRTQWQAQTLMETLFEFPPYQVTRNIGWNDLEVACTVLNDKCRLMVCRAYTDSDWDGRHWLDYNDLDNDPTAYYDEVTRAAVLSYIGGVGPRPDEPDGVDYIPDIDAAKAAYETSVADLATASKTATVTLPFTPDDMTELGSVGTASASLDGQEVEVTLGLSGIILLEFTRTLPIVDHTVNQMVTYEHQVGEVGTAFIGVAVDRYDLDADGNPNLVNLAGGLFVSATYTFYKPDGTTLSKVGALYTDGSDSKVVYNTVSGDFVAADVGTWTWRVTVVTTSGTYPSKRNQFTLVA